MIREDDAMVRSSLDSPYLKRSYCSAPDQHVVDSGTGRRVSVQPSIAKVKVSCEYNHLIGSSQFLSRRSGSFKFSARDLGPTELIRRVQIGDDYPAVHADCLADAPFATSIADLTLA
jgi:hypothetical protein